MALFNFGKKKEEKAALSCCCNSQENAAEETLVCCGEGIESIRSIKVLGVGCKSCHEQLEYAREAAAAMGLTAEVEYVTDMEKIMAYGVMSMPAIVVNEKVVSMGKVLKARDVEKLLGRIQS